MIEINTVIIGGGISGLSAGHFLKKKGLVSHQNSNLETQNSLVLENES